MISFFVSLGDAGKGADRDVIRDFEQGVDDINVRTIDANIGSSGDQAFHFIGSKLFTGTAGELRYKGEIVSGDVNGDRWADFQVALENNSKIGSSDFIL